MEILNQKSFEMLANAPGSGGHRKEKSTSLAAIWATLVPTIILASIYTISFLFLRKPFRNIYAPRTYFRTIPDKDRTPSSSRSVLSWFHDYRVLDDKFVLRHSSIDAYLFLRFFRIIILICFVGCCLTWPILIPINATSNGGATELDKISFSNVDDPKRLYAHAIVAWVFFTFIVLLVTRERLFAIGIRQAHASLKSNAGRLSSRVVLFLAAPPEVFKEGQLKKYFGGDAVRFWKVTQVKDLEKLVEERNEKVYELEGDELKFLKGASEHTTSKNQTSSTRNSTHRGEDPEATARSRRRWPAAVAKHFDQVDKTRRALQTTVNRIDTVRENQDRNPRRGQAIFVEFKDQLSAHQACQQIQHHSPLALRPRFVGVQPKEVLWPSLVMSPSKRITYYYLATAFIIITIIFWAIPIGFIGTISNVGYLADRYQWLNWVNDLPKPILGFLTGFVPPYVLSEVISYVPKFFRNVAKVSGQPTTIEAEKLTQTWYLIFQVLQVFLITTFTSGAAAIVGEIANNPGQTPVLLAQNLPKASNFYLAYFTVQGIASSAKNLINYSDVGSYIIYDRYIDKTPRDKYNNYSQMKGIGWGSVYPKFTNFAIIAIAYSCIAPLMLGFAAIGLYLYYLLYRYNLLYVVQVKIDTRGACYSRAMQHLMIGVYLAELCLLGLFSIKEATGPDVLMGILFVCTIIYHITVNKYLRPLEGNLPLDALQGEDEEQPLLAAEEDVNSNVRESREHSPFKQKASQTVHSILRDPLRPFLDGRIVPPLTELRSWMQDAPDAEDDPPQYSEEEITNAYKNPALTSKTPKIWLAKDQHGLSEQEVQENKAQDLPCTDEGAELNEKNHVVWDTQDLSKSPVFKKPSKI